jgi:carbamoyl-phosphate synthase small subunit|tara:strand:+ start:9317 stop:10477 length:1161 start_codon:yes stop_codon:yes gene_type:complete
MMDNRKAILALEDGSVFRGKAFGSNATVVGEAVFNTSMTGYQEILTDPSYYGQVVTMTAPQIGNYGIIPGDNESDGPKVAGFVIRELSPVVSNWRATSNLHDFLAEHGIPGIEGVDTRAITKRIRVKGALKSCLSTEGLSDDEALAKAREWPGLVGVDYVKEVTCSAPYEWDPEGLESKLFTVDGTNLTEERNDLEEYRVVALDFGAKHSIFRNLKRHGFEVQVVPANTTAEEVRALEPDGVFLANGPGDPAAVTYAHETVRDLIPDYPVFGICLGHQIITHALGASTYKLKFGHRGGNQPVKNHERGQVYVTAQNHGFAADAKDLEQHDAVVTETNLNDDTVSGLRHKSLPVFSVQYHPEAAPGPNDALPLFQTFREAIEKHKAG